MAITILPPSDWDSDRSSDTNSISSSQDDNSDFDQAATRPAKRPRTARILIPGETITTEPQWMRGHGTYIPTLPTTTISSTSITASLAGPLHTTNKLLSIHPLRARYTPSIGDLVIGRIVSLSRSRWHVDISAPLLAHLPLSSINLPGGVLRRRTTADELQMRSYFQEGELVIAEVQSVGGTDGVAMLHTRSLRYGKLRNGVFVVVAGSGGTASSSSGAGAGSGSSYNINNAAPATPGGSGGGGGGGGGGGVVRGKRQVFTLSTPASTGAGSIDVALGVNGYIWLNHQPPPTTTSKPPANSNSISVSNLDDLVSSSIYTSQNDPIPLPARTEIARLAASITALAGAGGRIDEEAVGRAYRGAVEEEMVRSVGGIGTGAGGDGDGDGDGDG